MDYLFDVSSVLQHEVTLFNASFILSMETGQEQVAAVIDHLGELSAKAQNLRSPITSYMKLLENPDHRLYILRKSEDFGTSALPAGYLKVGNKKLFFLDDNGTQHFCLPLCILDFYVHHEYQRRGLGKRLFEYVLVMENVKPTLLAYDRPSQKMLSFLGKHFGLKDPLPQPNNYVIFPEFLNSMLSSDTRDEMQDYDISPSDPLKRQYGPKGASEEFLANYHLLKHPKWYNPLRGPGALSPIGKDRKMKTPFHLGAVHVSKVPIYGRGPKAKKNVKDLAIESINQTDQLIEETIRGHAEKDLKKTPIGERQEIGIKPLPMSRVGHRKNTFNANEEKAGNILATKNRKEGDSGFIKKSNSIHEKDMVLDIKNKEKDLSMSVITTASKPAGLPSKVKHYGVAELLHQKASASRFTVHHQQQLAPISSPPQANVQEMTESSLPRNRTLPSANIANLPPLPEKPAQPTVSLPNEKEKYKQMNLPPAVPHPSSEMGHGQGLGHLLRNKTKKGHALPSYSNAGKMKPLSYYRQHLPRHV